VKVRLDEMLPAGIAGLLPDHEVTTVQQVGLMIDTSLESAVAEER
jgi:hypothetical protein